MENMENEAAGLDKEREKVKSELRHAKQEMEQNERRVNELEVTGVYKKVESFIGDAKERKCRDS